MSVSAIGSSSCSSWQAQMAQQTAGNSGSGPTSASTSVTNAGTTSLATSLSSFFQTFASDLQAMLSQDTNATGAPTSTGAASTGGSVATNSTQDATNQAGQATGHHHRHHGPGGSLQEAANGLIDSVGQILQSGSTSLGGAGSAPAMLAGYITNAISSYSTASTSGASLAVDA